MISGERQTWAGQAVLAAEGSDDCQLPLHPAHDLPHPVQGVLHPLQSPQQPEEAQVAGHGLPSDDGGQGLLHVVPQNEDIPTCIVPSQQTQKKTSAVLSEIVPYSLTGQLLDTSSTLK